jgi:cytochrome c oxidase assembly factor CtaG
MYLLIAILFVLAAGLVLLNLRIHGRKPAAWLRVLAVYALAAVVITPMVASITVDPEFRSILAEVMGEMAKSLDSAGGDEGALVSFMLDLAVRTYALGVTLFVLFCWYVVTRFRRRSPVQWRAAVALANFRIAEYVVWPLLASLAVFGAGRVVNLPPTIDIAVTVAMFGMVLLYFLQGLGIIAAWFGRLGNPGMRRMGLPLVLATLFLVPVLNFVLIVGIPLLGVLELWVSMRPATHDGKDVPVQGD